MGNDEIIDNNNEENEEKNEENDDESCNIDEGIENEDLGSKMLSEYYSGTLETSGANFLKLKEFVDKRLSERLSKSINIKELVEYCEFDIDIKDLSQENFQELISKVGEYVSYFSDKVSILKSFIKSFDAYVDLLKVYLILMSGKKKAEAEPEVKIKLATYYLEKEDYEELLSKLSGRKEAFENKYTVLSRILAFWDRDSQLSSAHQGRFKQR